MTPTWAQHRALMPSLHSPYKLLCIVSQSFPPHRLLQFWRVRTDPARAPDIQNNPDIEQLRNIAPQPEPLHNVAAAPGSAGQRSMQDNPVNRF